MKDTRITLAEQNYGPQLITAGTQADWTTAPTDELTMRWYGTTWGNRSLEGYKKCSVTGVSINLDVEAQTVAGTIRAEVRVDGAPVFSVDVVIDGVAQYGAYATQAPGIDVVAAGSLFTVQLVNVDFTGRVSFMQALFEIMIHGSTERRTTTVEIDTDGAMYLNGPLPLADETIDLSGIEFQVGN